MPKPTQAHLERIVNKSESVEARQKVLSQMPYYMGAKLLEVRIDPQSVLYLYKIVIIKIYRSIIGLNAKKS